MADPRGPGDAPPDNQRVAGHTVVRLMLKVPGTPAVLLGVSDMWTRVVLGVSGSKLDTSRGGLVTGVSWFDYRLTEEGLLQLDFWKTCCQSRRIGSIRCNVAVIYVEILNFQ